MLAVFLRSVVLHLSWFACSLIPGKHAAAPLSLRRIVFILLGFPLFCLMQLLHWLGFMLDELLFRGYRSVPIDAPVFISGIPRSGTTFVHRTLAHDNEQFTTVSTWEAILAPSISQRKLIRGLAALDRFCGSPLTKMIAWLSTKATGDFNDVHEVDLGAPEEDYLWLLPAGSCFIMLMAFPFSPWLKSTALLRQMPEKRRERLLDFYLSCVRRHLYCAPTGSRFLSKNAAFASWVDPLAKRLPDACFILCVREPARGLSSQLSSLKSARELFATDPDGQATTTCFTKIFGESLTELAKLGDGATTERIATIDQADLKEDPAGILLQTLERLAINPSESLQKHLKSLSPHQGSDHSHSTVDFDLKKCEIDVCLRPAYEMILQSKCRVRLRSN